MFTKQVSCPLDGVDSSSWPPGPSKSSELEESPGHGPDPSFVPYTELVREMSGVVMKFSGLWRPCIPGRRQGGGRYAGVGVISIGLVSQPDGAMPVTLEVQ
jgi:hypothetical protein